MTPSILDTADTPPRTQRLITALARAHDLLWEHDKRLIEAAGLSLGQARTLAALAQAAPGEHHSPTALAETVQASSGGMTKMLAALEKAGYVARVANPDDKRSRLVQVTETGRDRITTLMQELGTSNTERLAQALKPGQQDRLADALEHLIEGLA